MQFKIEQVAIAPTDPLLARELLADLGIGDWVEDTVNAEGRVHGGVGSNTANLAFNYDAIEGKELEVLEYIGGVNWLEDGEQYLPPTVSHLGMHCTEEELAHFRRLLCDDWGFVVAQEVWTQSHSNPAIKDERRYHYVIFDTRSVLGTDLKFIVRHGVGE